MLVGPLGLQQQANSNDNMNMNKNNKMVATVVATTATFSVCLTNM